MDALLKIVKESTIRISGTLAARALGYVLLMILTRLLAPGEYGSFVLAQSIISVALVLVQLGSPRALDRFIPFYNAAGELGKTKTLIQGIMRATLLLSLAAGLILLVAAGIFFRSVSGNPSLLPVLRIMLLTLPALAFCDVVSFTFIGYKDLRHPVYIQQLATPLLMTALAVVALARRCSLLGWTWMYTASVVGGSILALWLFARHIVPRLSRISRVPVSFRGILSYSWPLSLSSIVVMVLAQVPVLFLGYFRPSAEVGVFKVYVAVALLLRLIPQSIVQIYKPVISEMASMGRMEEVRETYRRTAKWAFLVNALGLLILLGFGARIVALIFTKNYLVAPAALLILAAGHFVDCSFGLKATTLEALARTRLFLVNCLITLASAVGLCVLLVPRHGIVGAAVATSCATVLGGLAALAEVYALYRLQPYDRRYLRYVSVALAAGCVAYVLGRGTAGLGTAGLLGSVLLLTALYAVGLHCSRSLDSVDRQVLNHIRARVVRAGRPG